MSVPAKRKSSSSTKRGRSHDALKPKKLVKCSNCGAAVKPHQVCANCGMYKGREVVKVKTKKTKTK